MPYKNGIMVIQEVRAYYDKIQKQHPLAEITRPRFVVNTAYKSMELKKLLAQIDVHDKDLYEKPIPMNLLVGLLNSL
jgi:hypothetical protein